MLSKKCVFDYALSSFVGLFVAFIVTAAGAETSGRSHGTEVSGDSSVNSSNESKSEGKTETTAAVASVSMSCEESLRPFAASREQVHRLCAKMTALPECVSVKGRVISHFDDRADGVVKDLDSGRRTVPRILVFGLIHGDEPLAAKLAVEWIQRLTEIQPRNIWRVVPVLNPDGFELKTRMNANRVDLNRNFPTRDWDEAAIEYWKGMQKSDPRRYPGEAANSEPETRCVVRHIEKFDPDLIVSIHTPYGVLDFDGPPVKFPKYSELPWKGLGNFPGSLGRYMWKDKGVPVLTIEMKSKLVTAAEIQDSVGLLMQTLLKKTKPVAERKSADRGPIEKSTVGSRAADVE